MPEFKPHTSPSNWSLIVILIMTAFMVQPSYGNIYIFLGLVVMLIVNNWLAYWEGTIKR